MQSDYYNGMEAIILERSKHAIGASQWLRNSVRLEIHDIRYMRAKGINAAFVSERFAWLWREYKLANKLAIMAAKHAAKMAAVQRDIDTMKGIAQ